MKKVDADYAEERNLFELVLETGISLSQHQHGIKTDGRGIRGMKIFTRQILTGVSLDKILPKCGFANNEQELWDISSIASLARNIQEGFLALHYFGLEQVDDNEAELRFLILQLHRNKEWYNLRLGRNLQGPELNQFEEGIKQQQQKIRNHPFLLELTSAQRNKALRGDEIYKTKTDFETELEVCKNLKNTYRLLSNLMHPSPLTIERINNEKGRGVRNEMDMNYCIISIMIARRFLAASIVGIFENFSDSFENLFKDQIDNIRHLTTKGV